MDRTLSLEIRKLDNEVRQRVIALSSPEKIDNITAMHGWIIGYLMEHVGEDVFQRDLEQNFKIRPSSVSSLLKLMEKNGLIMRKSVAYDARLKKIELTAKAYECNMQRRKDIMKIETQMKRGVSDEELAVFFNVIAKFRSNLKTEETK